jgi:hypothetical protein
MKKFFGLFILALVISFATLTSCNQPSKMDTVDSTSISATVDTTYLDVDTTTVDTSSFK